MSAKSVPMRCGPCVALAACEQSPPSPLCERGVRGDLATSVPHVRVCQCCVVQFRTPVTYCPFPPGGGRWGWGGVALLIWLLWLGAARPVRAHHVAQHEPAVLRQVGLEQRLHAFIPLDLMFRDETGKPVF